jgi:hypothetical protein
VGRHGGRSEERYAVSGHGVESGSHNFTGYSGASTALAPDGGGVMVLAGHSASRWWDDRSADGSAHPWWDDAPVPPPVVVASADGRTPAVIFSPDADPFSAGGVFARGARNGEPAVVVHPAPDAAVVRSTRRSRSSAAASPGGPGGAGTVDREVGSGADTGSLVRPYVAQADDVAGDVDRSPGASAALPDESGQVAEDDSTVFVPRPAERGELRPTRRARHSGDPLDRIVEIPPAASVRSEWSAPWTTESVPGQEDRQPASLFEPSTAGTADAGGPWTPPREQELPSRRAMRAKERGVATTSSTTQPKPALDLAGRDPASRTAGRRLAKSGVLAVTAVGVVAASAPNAFSALGWRLPSHPANPAAQAAIVGFAGSGALAAPANSLGTPGGTNVDAALALPDRGSLDRTDAAAARRLAAALELRNQAAVARAGAVAAGTGRTLVDVAREQVLAEAARKARITQQVSRSTSGSVSRSISPNAVRDPRAYAQLLLQARGWGDQFTCLNLLWNRESGWNYQATNPSSGAYGIPQSLPGSKMASIAPDWRTNPATQIKWGLNYIAQVYGTPCGAWAHSQATGWY